MSIEVGKEEPGQSMHGLVSTKWLDENLDDPDLIVLDCTNFAQPVDGGHGYRTVSGRQNWQQEHIEQSGHADFTLGLSGEDTRYRNTLPEPLQFAAVMGELGVGDGRRVVLYDSLMSMWAARVWWMLRWVGFDNAAVLNGGWQSWKKEGRRTSNKLFCPRSSRLTIRLRPELFVDRDAVKLALGNDSIYIVDALSEAQFRGENSDLGLCGHIPGALNIPATSLIDNDTGCYLPSQQLTERFPVNRLTPTIVYCGSGIAASSNAFAMTNLGFSDVAIYMPGLQEWIQQPDAPLINGPIS